MAAKKFRFVSPGIFLNEVDQSQLPAIAEAVGPVIIGRAEKGPGMIPVRVNSFSEFVETFGNPIDGKGGTDDQWRDVNRASPTYGAYAAQAYLKANVGPVNFVRLMGTQHADASSTGQAGWKTTNTPDVTLASNGGAYGLFVWPSASCPQVTLTVNSVKSIKASGSSIMLEAPDGTSYSASAFGGTIAEIGSAHHPGTGSATLYLSSSEGGITETTVTIAQAISASLEAARIAGFGILPVQTVTTNSVKVNFASKIDGAGALSDLYAWGNSSGSDGTSGPYFKGSLIHAGFATSTTASYANNTGSLAAVFYANSGVPVLSGTAPNGESLEGTGFACANNASSQFKVRVLSSTAGETKNSTFSLQEGSDNFIRRVFNTNPQLVNSTIEESAYSTHYWLGETYERYLADNSLNGNNLYGAIWAIASSSNEYGPHDKEMNYRDAHTGWFFAQNRSAATARYEYDSMEKLFKFVGINGHGSWLQNNIKISIDNIRASSNDNNPYGTFDIVIRKVRDSDLGPVVLERYSNCSLDPKSMDYISVKIGDVYQKWDDAEKRYREYGDYPNQSRYVRVVMSSLFDGGAPSTELLPFGVYGPPRFRYFTFNSGSTVTQIQTSGSYVLSSGSIPQIASSSYYTEMHAGPAGAESFCFAGVPSGATEASGDAIALPSSDFGNVKIVWPGVAIRSTATQDGATATSNAYFGLHTGKSDSSTNVDPGYGDYLRPLGADVIADASWTDTFGQSGYGASLEPHWTFTLDEIKLTKGSSFTGSAPTTAITDASWSSGSYKAATSWNAADSLGEGTARYKNILDSRVNRFTTPMFGGFDGFDITERDPFRNTRIDDNETELANYTYYTIRRAIDMVADPEVISCNMMSMPGLTNQGLTKHLIDTCEARADALGVIDLKGGFQPRHESNSAIASRQGDLDAVLSNMKQRNLNNSYGCAYYPWVTVRDDLNGSFVKVPPSVVAIGVLANTEKAADVWFAPAGFNRGGLSQGAGGLPVLKVETKLTSRNRDDLYDVNVNPIASFPAEGIVVFGQKTLQSTRSALDRINVRRLLIYVKKGISQIASSTLFQPNVRDTWNGFKSRAENFLSDVKVRFGVDDFKVILDETTTTPDLVDRNIMYAKIFIKPTRAIEFIAIDFVITRSGASFED